MKVRFIIEKQNSNLKNKAALDNKRNTIAGHILIDYRITCAMYNFKHNACCPDGENATHIAQLMKKNKNIKKNPLLFLLKKRFNTTSISPVKISDINDFPILRRKTLKSKVFMGSFQLRLCKSYLSDLIENGVSYQLNKNIIKTFQSQRLKLKLLEKKLKILKTLKQNCCRILKFNIEHLCKFNINRLPLVLIY